MIAQPTSRSTRPHASASGVERAAGACAALRPQRPPIVVVYGDPSALGEERAWAEAVAARIAPPGPAPRPCGALETGPVLARSILRGEPIVERGGAVRERWLRVSERIAA